MSLIFISVLSIFIVSQKSLKDNLHLFYLYICLPSQSATEKDKDEEVVEFSDFPPVMFVSAFDVLYSSFGFISVCWKKIGPEVFEDRTSSCIKNIVSSINKIDQYNLCRNLM